jgi:NAD+ kinase
LLNIRDKQVSQAFKRIGIFANHQLVAAQDGILKELKTYLLSKQLPICLEVGLAKQLTDSQCITPAKLQLMKHCDLIIVVGGDGSLLRAAHLVVDYDIPVLGINRGHLGFLADIPPQDFKKSLDLIFRGRYQETRRFLLEAEILSNTAPTIQVMALNEVALVSSDVAHMIEYQLKLDEQFVYNYRADGLIIATPTGSTAYALSGGGPIVHPQLNAFVLVPMFPHTLSARPLVVSADSILTISLKQTNYKNSPGLTCDGRQKIPLSPQTSIKVCKKLKMLRLIHPLHYQYFEALRSKLHW